MPEKPVAKLALDTRAHGPYFCQKCDAENEDALLMSDASVVCPECKEPMPEFQPFSDVIVSASPIKSGGKWAVPGAEKWVIEWTGPDTSRESTNAYDSREEALEVAADWAADEAKKAVDEFEWDEGDEEPELLNAVIEAEKNKNYLEAVKQWLDYQDLADPADKISIGPSGQVTDRSHELS
jgi:hypothetical protein